MASPEFQYEEIQKLYRERVLSQYSTFEPQLRHHQALCIHASLQKLDVFGICPTGSGKTLSMIVPTIMLAQLEGGKPCQIIISPLKSLMRDVQQRLSVRKLRTIILDSGFDYANVVQERATMDATSPLFLLCAAELIKDKNFKLLLRNVNVSFITVDEGHVVSTWGKSFRKDYGKIYELRAFVTAPLSIYTGTMTGPMLKEVAEKVGIRTEKWRSIVTSADRPEIFLDLRIKKPQYTSLDFLITELNRLKSLTPRTIIFANTISKVVDLLLNIRLQLDDYGRVYTDETKTTLLDYTCDMYFAPSDEKAKRRIEKDFTGAESTVAVLCATIGFGMGMDTRGIKRVILWDVPNDVTKLWQQIGRCSRDGADGEAILYIPNSPEPNKLVQEMKNSCIRKAILRHFVAPPGNEQPSLPTHDNCNFEKCICSKCRCCSYCRDRCSCPKQI